MTDDPTCARCARPMQHDTALICSACAAHLRRQLELVAKIAGDVTLTVARLDWVSQGGSGSPDTLGWWKNAEALEPMRLPYRPEAAERHDAAVNELSGWARIIAEERGLTALAAPQGDERPGNGSASTSHPLAVLAGFLAGNLEWLRHKPYADEAWLDLLAASGQLIRVVDTYVHDKPIIGLCACGTARHDGQQACERCDQTKLAYNRRQLDAATDDHAVTASEAAGWVANMGLVSDTGKLRRLIWAWADRGHIRPLCEHETCGQAFRHELQGPVCDSVLDPTVYRFGDVLARVMASPALRVA